MISQVISLLNRYQKYEENKYKVFGATTPLKNSKSTIADFVRETSLDTISKSFHYPVTKKKVIKYKGVSCSEAGESNSTIC